jgi:hypothetical protein
MQNAIKITEETLEKHKNFYNIRYTEIQNIKKESEINNYKNYDIDNKKNDLKKLLEKKELFIKENDKLKDIIGLVKIINNDIDCNKDTEIDTTLKRYLDRLAPNYNEREKEYNEIEKSIDIKTSELEILNKMIYIFDDDIQNKINDLEQQQKLTENRIKYFNKYLDILKNA